MAILSKEEFFSKIKERIGDSVEPEDISFIEDMTDTYTDLASQAKDDYKGKFEELKATYDRDMADWARKYRERFFTPADTESDETNADIVDEGEDVEVSPEKFDDLFD